MSEMAVDYWERWLAEIATVLRGTGTGRVAASLWADLIGMPAPEQMRSVRKAVLLDEQCARLGRVLPGDVVRLLRDEATADVPSLDEAIGEVWTQVSRTGRYAAIDGFDDVITHWSHPIVAAMASAAGWTELCDCTERQVMDGQLRRYHESLCTRWRAGNPPSAPRGFRAIVRGATPPPVFSGGSIPLIGHRVDEVLAIGHS